MSGFKYALTFTIGAAVGSVVTWQLLKSRYEQIAQEEIDSVKEVYARRHSMNEVESVEVEDTDNDTTDDTEYEETVKKSGYVNYSDMHESVKKEVKPNIDVKTKPYVISPNDFGEMDDYECISLTYYEADDILADDADEIIEDVDNTVGSDALDCFGEYEDDSVFVRDDVKKRDYEILLDRRSYSDVTGNNPHEAED